MLWELQFRSPDDIDGRGTKERKRERKEPLRVYLLRQEFDVKYSPSSISLDVNGEKESHFLFQKEVPFVDVEPLWRYGCQYWTNAVYLPNELSSNVIYANLYKWNRVTYGNTFYWLMKIRFLFFLLLYSFTHFLRNTFYNRHIVRRVWHELESLLNSWFQGDRLKHATPILRCLIDYSLPLNDVDCCCSFWWSSLGRWCAVYICAVNDVSFWKWNKI